MLVTHHQEKNWPAYEAALGNLAKLRVEQNQEQKSANPVELSRQRAEDLSSASAALKQLADAEEPLRNSLDDTQKHLFSFPRTPATPVDRRARPMRNITGKTMTDDKMQPNLNVQTKQANQSR